MPRPTSAARAVLTASLLLAAGLLAPPLAAQESDSTEQAKARAAFDSAVAANTYHMTLRDGELSGDGLDWLLERARGADHFLVGERHGTAEVAELSAALYERLAAIGYGHAALEIGPWAARDVRDALDRGGFAGLRDLLTRYEHDPVAFLGWREEARLAARIHAAGGEIWGLDQEFVGSLAMHLDALAEQAETPREREAVREIRGRMEEAWSGDPLGRATPEALEALRDAFEPRGDPEAVGRIDAMIFSNEIYAPYVRDVGNFYDSNVDRENYMKRNLIDRVRGAEVATGEAPRVFYKFGGLHSARHSGLQGDPRVFLGVFVSEWSRVRGEETFHVMADCHGGKHRASGQDGGGRCLSYLAYRRGEDGEPRETQLARHLSTERITVIDLAALRTRYLGWDFLDDRMRTAILAYDAYVAIPDVRPSTPWEGARGDGT